MNKLRLLLLSALLGLAPGLALAQGIGLVTTPPAGSIVDLNTTSPTNVGIAIENLASWVGSGGSMGDSLIGTGVNQVSIAGGATTVGPRITVGGASSDTNIGIMIAGKGTGAVHLGGTALNNGSLRVPTVASSVNQVQISGAVTGSAPIITVGGTAADANASLSITGTGTGRVTLGATTTCSGTTTATCQGQRFVASVTGLTTAAAGVSSAAMTVTNAVVLASTTQVLCQVNGYAGTGTPVATTVTPGTGTVSFTITNVANSGALNATVPVSCLVY